MELGKLEHVDLRNVWKNEASDFTEWLAKEENLSKLGNELDIELSQPTTGEGVGDFSADIVAQDEDGNKVVIENQLEKSNHDHLGKLITYAAGLGAKRIVWIVRELREEHRQAIDWLNEHTDDETQFFAVKMELYKIGNSPPAPKFDIVSNPNLLTKILRTPAAGSEPTKTKLQEFNFWKNFVDYATAKKTKLSLRSPRPQQYYDVALGTSKAHIALTVNTQENLITCQVYVPREKQLFESLLRKRKAIERELGEKLSWERLPRKKASRIKLAHKADFHEESKWESYFEWLLETAERFHQVFQKEIREAL